MSQAHYNRSTYSQNSRSIVLPNDTEDFTDEELIKQVEELKKQIKSLQLENEILEKAILRLDPDLMKGVQQAVDYASKIHSVSTMGLSVASFVKSQKSIYGMESLFSPSRLLTSPSRVSTRRIQSSANLGGTIIFGTGPRINVMERIDLVSTEMEIITEKLNQAKKKAAKDHALLKAQLEEVGVRMIDIQKFVDAFKQQVVIEGWDRIAQRIPAEVWVRYMTEWAKTADIQIGKLRLRISTLNTQFSKLKGQIKIKTELSQNLRPVDFEKIEIENQECEESIDKKISNLVELKMLTGDANLTLTIHKKAMNEQNNYLDYIKKDIENKKRLAVQIDRVRHMVEVQANEITSKLEDIKKLRHSWEVPDIMEYVQVKAELADLKNSIKLLENRRHIQHIALTSLNKQLNSMYVLT